MVPASSPGHRLLLGPCGPRRLQAQPAPAPRGARKGVGVSGQQGGRERRSVRRSPGWAVRGRRGRPVMLCGSLPSPQARTRSCPPALGVGAGSHSLPTSAPGGGVSPGEDSRRRRSSDGRGHTASLRSRCETRGTRALPPAPSGLSPGTPRWERRPGPGLSFPGIGRPLVPAAAPRRPLRRGTGHPGANGPAAGQPRGAMGTDGRRTRGGRRSLTEPPPPLSRRSPARPEKAPTPPRPAPPRPRPPPGEARGGRRGCRPNAERPLPGGLGPSSRRCVRPLPPPAGRWPGPPRIWGAGPLPKADRDRVCLPPIVQGLLLIG